MLMPYVLESSMSLGKGQRGSRLFLLERDVFRFLSCLISEACVLPRLHFLSSSVDCKIKKQDYKNSSKQRNVSIFKKEEEDEGSLEKLPNRCNVNHSFPWKKRSIIGDQMIALTALLLGRRCIICPSSESRGRVAGWSLWRFMAPSRL